MINVEKKKLHFKGIGGTEMKEHEVTMEFFKEIDPDKSKFAVRPREVSNQTDSALEFQHLHDPQVSFVLEKVEEGPYWDRLLETKVKQHWLKIDFMNWVDEDEEEEPGQGQDLGEKYCQNGFYRWIWIWMTIYPQDDNKKSIKLSFNNQFMVGFTTVILL